MFRIALLVALIFGIAAKPYKPWNKLGENAFQDTVRSEVGNMLLSVEVEPPEEMDQTDDDIDPKMKIWEDVAATGKEKRALVAEVDLDVVHHPSIKKFPAEYEEVEQDWDAAYHKARVQLDEYIAPLTAEYKMARLAQRLELVRDHLEPEEDMDDLHHPDMQSWLPSYQDDDSAAAPVEWQPGRNYDEPEEDLDDLYHH